jgi:hypothetical protein
MVAAKTHGRARSAQPDVSAAAWITPSSQGARPKLIIGGLALDFPSSRSRSMLRQKSSRFLSHGSLEASQSRSLVSRLTGAPARLLKGAQRDCVEDAATPV